MRRSCCYLPNLLWQNTAKRLGKTSFVSLLQRQNNKADSRPRVYYVSLYVTLRILCQPHRLLRKIIIFNHNLRNYFRILKVASCKTFRHIISQQYWNLYLTFKAYIMKPFYAKCRGLSAGTNGQLFMFNVMTNRAFKRSPRAWRKSTNASVLSFSNPQCLHRNLWRKL